MPRLRVTAVLSLLALLIGIVGTGWLSGLTGDWVGPPPRTSAMAATHLLRPATHRRRHGPPRVLGAEPETAGSAAPALLPSLVPLETPPGPISWVQMRGHLDGRVVLDITADGGGHVTGASVAQSSGDPVLDAHALATVQHWRFAVPAGSPGGVHGELPIRFDSPKATPP